MLIVGLLAAALTGCGGTGSDPIASGKAFLEAFPDKDTLMVPAPGWSAESKAVSELHASVEQTLVGDRAWLHDLSLAVALQVNHQAARIFGTLWVITRFAPSVAKLEDGFLGESGEQVEYDAWAVWGPFEDSENKNLEYILKVWRAIDPQDGQRLYVWFAAGRPVGGGEEDWVVFLLGGAKPTADSKDGVNRMGIVEVNLDAVQELNPTEEDVGYATYAFMQGDGFHAVAAVGEGVWTDESHTQKGDVTYFYGRSLEGYTVFDFDIQNDIESVDGELLEDLHVTTGWVGSGGRSDATITGGDLGDQSAMLTQCWGLDLKQTYFHLVLPPPKEPIEDGDVNQCFTADPIEIPDIDFEAIRDLFDFDFS